MGRFVKNTEIRTGSHSVRVPTGSSTVGPDYPIDGLFRFDKDSKFLQVFHDNKWYSLSVVGDVSIVKDEFVGNDVDVSFGPMSITHKPGAEASVLVFIGNIFQNPGVAYNFSDLNPDQIIFTSPPGMGSSIVILHNFASTNAAM